MKKLLLICSLGFSVAALAQNGGKIHLKKGQTLEITTETKKNSNMDIMGQSMESTATTTVTEQFSVADASGENATVHYSMKRMVVDANSMGQSQKFDSDKDSDRKGELGKMFGSILNAKYTMKIDGKGNVIEVSGTSPKSKDEEALAAVVASQVGLNVATPKAGEASLFKILPDRDVKVGEKWTTNSSDNGTKTNTEYVVTAISDNEITVNFIENLEMNSKQDMMGFEANIAVKGKSAGTIILDKATGLMKQKTATNDMTGTIEAQGMSIPTSEKSTVTVTLKTL